MPKFSNIVYYAFHPQELRSIIQWGLWHQPVHQRDEESEPVTLKHCFRFLDLTSRSFSAVIKELNPELLVPVCVFYLILRGLDTIEDDMTISLEEKEPLLRDFHKLLQKDGWTYDGNGPDEKDRQLLVEFHFVITEYKKIKPNYQDIIKDITQKMGNGMADYANNAEHNINGVNTVQDYYQYCHYVAGLVGEGLTRLFVESGLARPSLMERPDLHESMGQFLQQTNIIRDIHEDMEDKRRFWPKEIWSKHVEKFEDLFKPENQETALRCSSEMILLALERANDCLFYLAGIRDQSVFNFAAIPQSMAIATLETCFRNPLLFKKNVKITKGEACQLMLESSQNLQLVCEVFKRYARKIHKKNDPRDPNFLKISIACGKIEQFIESIFPSQDPKAIVRKTSKSAESEQPDEVLRAKDKVARQETMNMAIAMLCVFLVIVFVTICGAWLGGARLDLIWEQIKQGNLGKPTTEQLERLVQQGRQGHVEL